MPDDFEQRLRDARRAEAGRLPFAIDAASIRHRLGQSPSRGRGILVAAGIPVLGLVVLAAVLLLSPYRPGQGTETPEVMSSKEASSPAVSVPAHGSGESWPYPFNRTDAAWTSSVDQLYLVGGTGYRTATAVSMLDLGVGWVDLPDLPEPRLDATAVVTSDGDLFVFGGRRDDVVIDTTLRLESGGSTWSYGQPMPEAAAGMAAAVHDGRIYLFGGSRDPEQAVMIYDPAADAWESGAPMPEAAPRAAAVAFEDSIYVFGSQSAVEDSPQFAYRYDPRSDSWESLGEMPLRASALSAMVVDGRIWVLARNWTWVATTPDPAPDERFGRVLVLDPTAERWSVSDQRVNPLGGGGTQMAVPLANGDLYVLVTSPCCSTSNTIHTADEP
jgi:hypothetical protein